jgi:hypothetical protein
MFKRTEYRDRAHFEAKRQLSGLQIVEPSLAEPSLAASGFQYGYLVRLIDDQDLDLIEDPEVRAAVRAAHHQVYWKTLRLLKRDVKKILVNRRKLMETRKEWRFEVLISDTARIWQLIWILQLAGAAHSMHIPMMISAARAASVELQALVAIPFPSVPQDSMA